MAIDAFSLAVDAPSRSARFPTAFTSPTFGLSSNVNGDSPVDYRDRSAAKVSWSDHWCTVSARLKQRKERSVALLSRGGWFKTTKFCCGRRESGRADQRHWLDEESYTDFAKKVPEALEWRHRCNDQ